MARGTLRMCTPSLNNDFELGCKSLATHKLSKMSSSTMYIYLHVHVCTALSTEPRLIVLAREHDSIKSHSNMYIHVQL